jgi:hypothetical protein
MSRTIAFVIRNSGALLLLGTGAILIFILSVCAVHHSFSSTGVAQSVQIALGLLMAMDTPPNILRCYPGWLIAFGWAISLAGWLFIPLFVGQVVATALSRQELDLEYSAKLRDLGTQFGLSGQQLDDFVTRTLRAKDEIFSTRPKKR